MKKHSEDAAAKINLFLHITGKRPDGYHLLYSHVVFCPDIADRIVYKETKGNSFTFKVKGPYRDSAPADDSNLVVKTLKLFCEKFDLLLCGEITLYKNLPVGAGIGGGSSDAAAALRLFSRLHKIDDDSALLEIAEKVGADVPMCLKQHGAIVTGIGEKIETFESLPQSNIVLVNPNRPVLTADVFKSLKGEFNAKAVTPFGATSTKDYFNWLSIHSNDLAPAAEDLCRDIKKIREVLERQKGQGYLGMSGSGATCFALFENERDTRKAARKIKRENPNWWVKKGLINKR